MSTSTVLEPQYEIINGRKIVKKHVATIHCSNKLSLLERKISNALLWHAYPNLKSQITHQISIDELRNLLDFNSNNTMALKKALRSLISTVIEWNLLGDNVSDTELEGWNATTLLASVKIESGRCVYQYSEILKSLLLDPSVYGKINLYIQSRFKSAYGLALYENCVRFRSLPNTKNFDYKTFRKLMGVEDGKYKTFADFNKRVLAPAVEEVNTLSDIHVTAKITRQGRVVQAIMFLLEERPMKKRIGGVKNSAPESTASDSDSLSEQLIEKLIAEFGLEDVKRAVDYVTGTKAFLQGKISNIESYIRSAIEHRFGEANADIQSKMQKILLKKRDHLNQGKKYIAQYQSYKTERLKTIVSSLTQEILTQLLETFEQSEDLKQSVFYGLYQKEGIKNVLLFETVFLPYLERNCPELLKDMISYEAFQKEMESIEIDTR